MINTYHHIALILVATAFAHDGAGRPALSQDRDRPVREQQPLLLEDLDQAFPMGLMLMDQGQFDVLVFGQASDVDAARRRLEKILTRRVESLANAYQLTEAQKKKLMVAGRGDIKRFFDSFQEARAKFPLFDDDQLTILAFHAEIQQLVKTYRSNLFTHGSIFAKTLSKTLDEDQSTRFNKEVRASRENRFRVTVTWVAGTLELTLKLTNDQRRRLEKVLIAETRVPEAFGTEDYYGLMFQASKIPEAKLKPIFDDDQWLDLLRQFRDVRSMEMSLKQGGFLPIDAADDRRALEEPRILR